MKSLWFYGVITPALKLGFIATLGILWGVPSLNLQPHMAYAAEVLSLDAYLAQVKGENPGVKGALLASQGAQLRSIEAQLLLAPTLYSNFQLTQDSKIPQISLLGYDNQVTKVFSLGVSQLTPFGLQAKLHYDILSSYYNNAKPNLFSSPDPSFSYANASPILELTQNLWSNAWGRSTKATQEQTEAQALSASYTSRFQAKSNLSQAEMAYWTLALAKQTLLVQKEALDRAKKIYEWSSRRARLLLADPSDVLQAEALMQSRELDLMSAENQVRNASRTFNSARNQDSDRVEEQLAQITPELTTQVQIPRRAPVRDDVKAAQQATRAAIANSEISLERDSPTFDLFANLSLNGQPSYDSNNPDTFRAYPSVSQSMGSSFSLNRPTYSVGFKFSMPLDLTTTSQSRDGWKKERIAAELNYDRKLFDQENSWKDLNETLTEAKKHLELSHKLETIQEAKLNAERRRLQHGRTTTYQVLLFEQDFLLAQLVRIRDQANILNIIAQMKLFGESI